MRAILACGALAGADLLAAIGRGRQSGTRVPRLEEHSGPRVGRSVFLDLRIPRAKPIDPCFLESRRRTKAVGLRFLKIEKRTKAVGRFS